MTHEESRERPLSFEDGQDIRNRCFAFACRVAIFCQSLYEQGGVGRMMVPQLLHCSLSTATMLEEARAAESDADFISKCCIGLKECRESWTRLRVCVACRIGLCAEAAVLAREANELVAIVTTIIRNKKRNVAAKEAADGGVKPRRRKVPPRSHAFQIPNS